MSDEKIVTALSGGNNRSVDAMDHTRYIFVVPIQISRGRVGDALTRRPSVDRRFGARFCRFRALAPRIRSRHDVVGHFQSTG
jgi:hypothetical protein